MGARNTQINEMIEATMKLAQSASALELEVASCLYRMAILELTNLVEEPIPAVRPRTRVEIPIK